MINDKEAGVSCNNCGNETKVYNRKDACKLEDELIWHDGDPVCPQCCHKVWFEDYLD